MVIYFFDIPVAVNGDDNDDVLEFEANASLVSPLVSYTVPRIRYGRV